MSDNDTIPKKSTSQINKAVFFTSALLIFLLVAFAAVFPDVADKNFKLLQQQIFTNASWFYILAVALILLSVTFLGLSRYGDIKLGPDHAQPDFSYHSGLRCFSAGDGDRPDVLWRCRTCNALSFASRWHARNRCGSQGSNASDLLPLGTARMGNLCHCGADSGVLQLPSRSAFNSALRTLSHYWRSHIRACRPCG